MRELQRLWRGDLSLPAAFWGWLVLGGVLVNGMTTALNLILVTRDLALVGLIVGYAISVPYNLLALLGVWRSAGAWQGDRAMATTARVVAVVWAIGLSVT